MKECSPQNEVRVHVSQTMKFQQKEKSGYKEEDKRIIFGREFTSIGCRLRQQASEVAWDGLDLLGTRVN